MIKGLVWSLNSLAGQHHGKAAPSRLRNKVPLFTSDLLRPLRGAHSLLQGGLSLQFFFPSFGALFLSLKKPYDVTPHPVQVGECDHTSSEASVGFLLDTLPCQACTHLLMFCPDRQ